MSKYLQKSGLSIACVILLLVITSFPAKALTEYVPGPEAIDPALFAPKDDYESLADAARSGNAAAQTKLAKLYEDKNDLESAAYWFEQAAENNDPEAEYKIGRYYLRGLGGKPQDPDTALKHISAAARLGHTEAVTLMGNYCYYLKDYDNALGWFRNAAAKEDPEAIYRLGLMYENGEGVEKNDAEAFKHFKTAAGKGHDDAWINLGIDYLLGRGTKADYNLAKHWIEKAAEAGKPAAQAILGDIYCNGWGVKADYTAAQNWYEKAIQGGSTEAKDKLSRLRSRESAREKVREKAKETTKIEEKPRAATIRKRQEQPKQSKKGTAPGIYKAVLDLKFTGPTNAKVGDRYKYVVSIKNSGSETAENVVIDYTLPIGILLASDPGTKSFTVNVGNMAPGTKKSYNVDVVADYAGIFINSVSVKGANAHDKHSSICTKVINRR